MQILYISGHAPNLKTDVEGNKLEAGKTYLFDFEDMAFRTQAHGPFTANHIKLLRLGSGTEEPTVLKQVKDAAECVPEVLQLAKAILSRNVRI
jgi:hypothetical protein